jgi:7,8-dihydropterin-6-yl-methyl-4-(beta-D-ribofuranosyl)aminobenzene 5'-phosphate synthase
MKRPFKVQIVVAMVVTILCAGHLGAQTAPSAGPAVKKEAQGGRDVTITVVYDNIPLDKKLETAWGFACVVEGLSETILFDTGGKGKLLLSNMAAAGVKPGQIDSVVLSHAHGDHTGGLQDFLHVNNKVKVFAPKAFPSEFKQAVGKTGARLVETEGPQEVCPGAWTTGVLEQGIQEQGLYVETPAGLLVITGCAHPGIVQMAKAASRHAGTATHAVLGGFHMGRTSGDKIDTVIQGLKTIGVQQVAPSHCSGDKTRQLMKEASREGYLPSGLGAQVVFQRKRETEER